MADNNYDGESRRVVIGRLPEPPTEREKRRTELLKELMGLYDEPHILLPLSAHTAAVQAERQRLADKYEAWADCVEKAPDFPCRGVQVDSYMDIVEDLRAEIQQGDPTND